MVQNITVEEEFRRLERELENLVGRYCALEDAVYWLQLGFRVSALIAMAAFGVAAGNRGIFLVALASLILSAIAALSPIDWSGRRVRWIDLVGWQPPGLLGINVKRSEAMAIEDMIAERSRLLAQLCEQSHA
jgi:hypothetical protein